MVSVLRRRRPAVVAPVRPVPGPGRHPAQGRLPHLHGQEAARREHEASSRRHHQTARHQRQGGQGRGQAGSAQAGQAGEPGQWRERLRARGRGGQGLRTSQTVQAPGRLQAIAGGCNWKVVVITFFNKIAKKPEIERQREQYDTVVSARQLSWW